VEERKILTCSTVFQVSINFCVAKAFDRVHERSKRALLWCHIVVIPQLYSTLCTRTQCHWRISKWEVTSGRESAKKYDKIQLSWC